VNKILKLLAVTMVRFGNMSLFGSMCAFLAFAEPSAHHTMLGGARGPAGVINTHFRHEVTKKRLW